MAETAARIRPLIALILAAALLGWALFVPWWGWTRESGGSTRWERYGPFERPEGEDGFGTQTTVLGLLAAAAALLLIVASTSSLMGVVRGSRRPRIGWWTSLSLLLVASSVAYPVYAFPPEVNRGRDLDLSFIDRECRDFASTTSICFVTRADLGWYLAAGSGVLVLVAMAARRMGRSDADVELPASARMSPPSSRVAVVRPASPVPGAAIAASSAPTLVTKCPQCQTKVSYRRAAGGALAECHNCGLRFPA